MVRVFQKSSRKTFDRERLGLVNRGGFSFAKQLSQRRSPIRRVAVSLRVSMKSGNLDGRARLTGGNSARNEKSRGTIRDTLASRAGNASSRRSAYRREIGGEKKGLVLSPTRDAFLEARNATRLPSTYTGSLALRSVPPVILPLPLPRFSANFEKRSVESFVESEYVGVRRAYIEAYGGRGREREAERVRVAC